MTKPVAPPDNVTQPWWDATREERLLVQRCEGCGHAQLYPRSSCTACHGTELSWAEASGRGTVYSHTTVHRAPSDAFTAPYVVLLVRLEEGPVVMANLAGQGEVRCDQPVEAVWEDLPDGRKLLQFAAASRT
ncbi:MAG TPA: Zn-ribbon domain-containing OB-fold protein [Actinomycetota bacterium]|nr:Zn-ribbon domain-containing OB-fold protein [Actinomycetota bacterium]